MIRLVSRVTPEELMMLLLRNTKSLSLVLECGHHQSSWRLAHQPSKVIHDIDHRADKRQEQITVR
eukprot:scaffold148285_cov28-Cyclotella_meneghiniana.AAC.2